VSCFFVVASEVFKHHVRFDLAIRRISSLEQKVFARSDFKKRLDIGMPTVMACARIIA
jgi:hypothetical protein